MRTTSAATACCNPSGASPSSPTLLRFPSSGIRASVTPGRYAYRVLALPGHSRDHIGLFEETRGWLFSGDAYIGGRDRVLRRDYDVWDMIRTFRSLASLPINAMFTGTGHVLHDPVRRIERKLEYL